MNWPASAIRLTSVSLSVAAFLGLATGCEKANDLGLELPGTSPISTQYQDITLPATTSRQAPVQTAQASHFLVGRVRDANVGTTTARAFLNAQIGSPDSLLATNFTDVKLDSVVLHLGFNQVYGTATQPVRLDLFQLQQPLGERTAYNSESSVPTSTALLSGFAGSLNRNRQVKTRTAASSTTDTTTTVITTTVPDRVVRIPLLNFPQTAALANALFSAQRATGFNQDKINTILRGLALGPTAGFQDNVVAFNRTNETRIAFYYQGRTRSGAKLRPIVYNILFGNAPSATAADAKFFTQLSTDFSGTRLAALNSPGAQVVPTSDFPYTYLQEGVALGTRIELQGLSALKSNTNRVINRAELLIPIRQYSNGLFPYAPNVYLYEVDNQNKVLERTVGATTAERLVQAEGTLPNSSVRISPAGIGYPASATFPLGLEPQYYSLNMTEYIQAYLTNRLNGDLPSGLLLSPVLRSNTSLTLNRSLLDASSNGGIKLRVYYSTLQ
ncbi:MULTISPECIES: DUF4270 family protein [Hymenobacter]|uniref:DUF4270 domain-containing protein n=1 Tax=Hymenobacter mucosus TaxID=1411120 RepID=A0A238WS52_9BACT|nr:MULTISPECIES: DUF4270 family protein [Hymenobacter]SNR49342.1 protein of unknown function [Hymenobacter mucosus]